MTGNHQNHQNLDDDQVHFVRNLNSFSASCYCMHVFNIVRRHIGLIFNTKRPISSFFFVVVVKCDYVEALHIEMHVHTSNLNTAFIHDDLDTFFHGKLQ